MRAKKDATLTKHHVNEKWYPKVELRELYVVLDGNGYMIADSDQEVRCQAVHVIQKFRKERGGSMSKSQAESGVNYESDNADVGWSEDELSEEEQSEEDIAMSKDIRYYRVPQLNWGAMSLPLTRNLSDAEFESVIDNAWQVRSYSCHTQAVERTLKIVSDVSSPVYGETERDGFILHRIHSRKLMHKVDTKRDLQV